MYIHMYIYIYRERERLYIYIYIYQGILHSKKQMPSRLCCELRYLKVPKSTSRSTYIVILYKHINS